MIHLSSRELHILKVLFDKAPLNVAALSEIIGVSTKTIHADINSINLQLKTYKLNCSITKDNNLFEISYQNDTEYKSFKNQVKSYQKKSSVSSFDNERVSIIIRNFVLKKDYIKGEFFEDLFNISDTTLTTDLKEVRDICKHYNLKIETKPYHGMKLVGTNMAKLSIFLDFHDIYTLDDNPYLACDFYSEFDITPQYLSKLKFHLSEFSFKFNLDINHQALIDLAVCIVILKHQNLMEVDEFILEYDYNQEMQTFLKTKLQLDNAHKQAYFLHYLWFKVDVSSDVFIINEKKNFTHYLKTMESINQEIGLDLKSHACLPIYLSNLELRINHAQKTQFRSYKYCPEKKALTDYLNVSKVLSYIIYQDLSQNYSVPFFFDWWINLSMFIYNKAYTVPNVYKKLDIIIINPHKKYFNESFVYRSDLDLTDIKTHYHYEHELPFLDLTNYDAILAIDTDIKSNQKTNIPVINFDYYVKQKEYRTIWNKILMNKKKKDLMSTQLLSEIKDIQSIKNYTQLIEELYQNLPYQYDIYANSKEDFLKLSKEYEKERGYFDWVIFVIQDSDSEIVREKNKYYSKIALSNSLLSVKQAESLIRRKVSTHYDTHSK